MPAHALRLGSDLPQEHKGAQTFFCSVRHYGLLNVLPGRKKNICQCSFLLLT